MKAEFIIEGVVHSISDELIIKVPQENTDYFFEVNALDIDLVKLRRRDLVRIEGTLYNTTTIYPDIYGNSPPVYKYHTKLFANKIIKVTGNKHNENNKSTNNN